jgi:hypothetical protein
MTDVLVMAGEVAGGGEGSDTGRNKQQQQQLAATSRPSARGEGLVLAGEALGSQAAVIAHHKGVAGDPCSWPLSKHQSQELARLVLCDRLQLP